MIALNRRQEEVFFTIASYMDIHEQDGFCTVPVTRGIVFIRVHFLPSMPDRSQAIPNQPMFKRDDYDRAFFSLHDYFDNMRRDYPGSYEAGPLTPMGQALYEDLVRAKILERLSSTEIRAIDHHEMGVSANTFERNIELLRFPDSSIELELVPSGEATAMGYRLSETGLWRIRTGTYNLSPHPLRTQHIEVNGDITANSGSQVAIGENLSQDKRRMS